MFAVAFGSTGWNLVGGGVCGRSSPSVVLVSVQCRAYSPGDAFGKAVEQLLTLLEWRNWATLFQVMDSTHTKQTGYSAMFQGPVWIDERLQSPRNHEGRLCARRKK